MENTPQKVEPAPSESKAVEGLPTNPFAGLESRPEAGGDTSQPKQPLPKVPRALTKRVLKKIADLECVLRVHSVYREWPEIPSWQTVLGEYRGSVASGITEPRFVQKYGAFCLASVEALHEAFQDVHGYDPDEYLTEGSKAAAQNLFDRIDARLNRVLVVAGAVLPQQVLQHISRHDGIAFAPRPPRQGIACDASALSSWRRMRCISCSSVALYSQM